MEAFKKYGFRFWHGTYRLLENVYNLKSNIGEMEFPLLMKLVNYLIVLPYSSAYVERIFSCINLNKTKIRNRLGTETLTGIPHSKNNLNT